MNRRDLPIFELEAPLLEALRKHPRLILEAPTGSGKSTQVPQILLDSGSCPEGEIVVLQPRRLAARVLAARVAHERGVQLGEEVGYQIRFERRCSARTRIRFVTEGVLARQILTDPLLRGVTAILFDEFHERHLDGDITLARALELQRRQRPDLRLLVMSATLDSGLLRKHLAPCETLTSQGRTFPVAIEYLERSPGDEPIWDVAARELDRLLQQTDGDALVFMPGGYEINRTIQSLRHSSSGARCALFPLHGELSPADQDAALARNDRRKIIVATNVAETSLTIEGVRLVVDSGLARIARFDPGRGINSLLVERIARSSADQRAGRAGRSSPGRCLRLWTAREHESRAAHELPEIRRLDLAEVVLALKAGGIADLAEFPWLEPPEERSLLQAQTLLIDLGALDETGALTSLGRRMLDFPAHPRYARMLLAARDLGCVPEAALAAALTQGRNLLRRPENKEMQAARDREFEDAADSDFTILMRAFRYAEAHRFDVSACRPLGINALAAREAAALRDQFLHIARAGAPADSVGASSGDALRRCILAGFPDQVGLRLDAGTLRCALVHGRRGILARETVVQHAPLLVAGEARELEIKGDRQVLLSLVTAIEETWLQELFPAAFQESVEVRYDEVQRRVVARRAVTFRDLAIRVKESDDVPLEAAATVLARQVAAGLCPLKNWDESVEQWITRLNLLAQWRPEFALPPIAAEDRQTLLEQICLGARSYREIKERPVWPAVKSWLSPLQQDLLEEHAPERLPLPNGRHPKIVYSATAQPTIAARIQDLYGVEKDLKIAGGTVTLIIQVLAPNHRPIQVTQHLGNFWKESYPKLKQELQRRYPKHLWK